MTISEHLQLMVMEPLGQLRLEQESLQPVQEQCWQRHKQHLILRRLVFHKLAPHRLVRSILVRMDHTLASGSSA